MGTIDLLVVADGHDVETVADLLIEATPLDDALAVVADAARPGSLPTAA